MSEKNPGKNTPFMPAILRRLAPQLKAKVILEPEYQIVGRIIFPNKRQTYFWHNKFNLNPVSSARIASDKAYTTHFLDNAGIRVPRTQTFFSDRRCRTVRSTRNIAAAIRYAGKIGWPVYVKPCRGSQGSGIEKASNARELRAAATRIFKNTHTLLVQETCIGRDYRLVMLDGELISAYERVPLSITGDGKSTITQLLHQREQHFIATGRDTRINFADPRLAQNLKHHRLRPTSILPRNRTLPLLEVANLSCGGESVEMTSRVHPTYQKLAARVAETLDLRFVGVDIIAPDITRPAKNYNILEVNSAPGLDHYSSHGPDHEKHIDALYLRVLRAIERGPK